MKIEPTKDDQLIAKLNKPVHDLHCALYPSYFQDYDYEEMRALFAQMMKNNQFIFLLASEEEEAVGYAWVEIRHYHESVFNKAYQSIYVHQLSIIPTKQQHGYGTALMEAIEQIAKRKRINLVELDYWADNSGAEIFYEKGNFIPYRKFVYKRLK